MQLDIANLAKVKLDPNDVLIVKIHGRIAKDEAADLSAYIRARLDHNRCLVIDDRIDLQVVSEACAHASAL